MPSTGSSATARCCMRSISGRSRVAKRPLNPRAGERGLTEHAACPFAPLAGRRCRQADEGRRLGSLEKHRMPAAALVLRLAAAVQRFCSTRAAFHARSLSMKTEVKICGLKTAGAVERAVALGASHVGFIFFPKSPRNIEPDDAGRLAARARGRAKIVAVTVDADNDGLDEIVSALDPRRPPASRFRDSGAGPFHQGALWSSGDEGACRP
jgi:hypothetical protein